MGGKPEFFIASGTDAKDDIYYRRKFRIARAKKQGQQIFELQAHKSLVRNIMVLVKHGMAEERILELPMDKFDLYVQEAQRSRIEERSDFVSDIAMVESVKGGSKKAQDDYKLTLDAWTDEINHG